MRTHRTVRRFAARTPSAPPALDRAGVVALRWGSSLRVPATPSRRCRPPTRGLPPAAREGGKPGATARSPMGKAAAAPALSLHPRQWQAPPAQVRRWPPLPTLPIDLCRSKRDAEEVGDPYGLVACHRAVPLV